MDTATRTKNHRAGRMDLCETRRLGAFKQVWTAAVNFVWRLCLCLLYLYGRDESLLCYSTKLSCERRPEAATARHQAVTPPLPPAGLFPGRRRRAFFVVYVRCGGVGRARAAVRWRVTPHPSDQYTTRDSPVERPASSTERGAPPSLCWRAQPALARRCLGNIGILCPRRAHCVVSCRGRAVVPARLCLGLGFPALAPAPVPARLGCMFRPTYERADC